MSDQTERIVIEIDGTKAESGARRVEAALHGVETAAKGADPSVRGVGTAANTAGAAFSSLGGAAKTFTGALSAAAVLSFGKAVMDAGIAADSLKRSLVAISGSQTGAVRELAFLRAEAERLGQSFYDLAPAYKSIAASARGTAIEGEQTRKIFSAIAEASTALGLSSDQSSRALNAIGQMMSKGNVQAEELRQQLGEALPGAFKLMADAMGVSQSKLNDMLDKGEVLATDALPKLADAIHKMYGEAAQTAALESGQAAINRLSQEWTDLKSNLFDTEAFVTATNAITQMVKAGAKAAGAWTLTEQLANAEHQLKGMEQITDTPMATIPGFEASLSRQRALVQSLKAAIDETAGSYKDMWLVHDKGASAAAERSEGAIAAQNKAHEALVKYIQTQKDALKADYEKAVAGAQSEEERTRALEVYNEKLANLNEKETKSYESAQKKQTRELEKQIKERNELYAKQASNTANTELRYFEGLEKANDRAIELVNDRIDAELAAEEKLVKDIEDLHKKEIEKRAEEEAEFMERIQESTADIFYDLFQNIGDGWSNLWESMKNWALRILAELAAKAATTQIVVPILTTLGSAGTASAASSLSGSGGVGNLLSSIPGGSLLNQIPGVSAVTDFLGATLPGTSTTVAAPAGFGTVTYGGLSLGSTLTMGGLGGLGYSMLGGAIGLPQNQYSGITSSLGGSLGAWGGSALGSVVGGATAGSVLPVVGTIAGAALGGLASSLFGGDEQSPSVIFQKQTTGWGQDTGFQFHTKDGASTSSGNGIADALGQVAGSTFDSVETLLSSFGEGYVDQLKDATITWGRKSGGLWGSWDFGSDHDFEELFAKASADLQAQIYEAAAPAFQNAGLDMVGSESASSAFALLSDGSAKFADLIDVIRAGVQGNDLTTYVTQLQAFQTAIQNVNVTWSTISQASAELVSPLTQYEQQQRAINAQYDTWIATLENLGFATRQVEQIERDRTAVLSNLAAENAASIATVVQAAAETATPLTEYAAAQRNINDQFDGWIDQLKALGAATEMVTAVEASRATALRNLQAQMEASIAAANAAAASAASAAIGQAKAELAGQDGTLYQIAQRYGWGSQYMGADGSVDQAGIQRDAIDWYKGASEQQIKDAAAYRNTTVDQLTNDILYLDGYLKRMSSTTDTVTASNESLSESTDKTADQMADLARSIAEYRMSLITGEDSGYSLSVRQAMAKAEFERVSRLAYGGDQDAAANLQNVADEWLSVSKLAASSQTEYARTVGDVLDALNIVARRLSGEYVPGFASGGYHSGGLRIVGENGPELEATGPSMIWTAAQTRAYFSGSSSSDTTSSEVRALRSDLQAIGSALARNTLDTAKLLKRWEGDGMPEVRTV